MADAQLKIRIGADVSGAVSGAAQVKKAYASLADASGSAAASISALGGTARKTASAFDFDSAAAAAMSRITESIEATAKAALQAANDIKTFGGRLPLTDINAFKKSVDGLTGSIKSGFIPKITAANNSIKPVVPEVNKLTKATSAGNIAVLDFSRIIQDLPYGIQGVTNNITQLPISLGALSRAAKESGKSMTSLLFSSVTGFSGIGLALSTITSGLLIFQNGIAGFNRKSKEAKQATDELKESIKDLADVQGAAIAGTRDDINTIQTLASAISDANIPYEQRKRALEELRSINKAYFGDLQLEDAATGKLAKTVDDYSKALINAAITKEFASEIASVAKAAILADNELAKSKTKLNQLRDEEAKAIRDAPRGEFGELSKSSEALDIQKQRIAAEKKFLTTRDKVEQLTTQQVLLEEQHKKALIDGLKFKSLQTSETGKEVDLLKKRLEALEKIKDATKDIVTITNLEEQIFDLKVKITLRDAAKNGLSKEETDLAIAGFRDQLNEAFENEALAFEAITKVKPVFILDKVNPEEEINSLIAKSVGVDKQIKVQLPDVLLQFQLKIDALEKIRQQLIEGIANSLSAGLQESFNIIGSTIGEALSGGNIGELLAKAGQSFLGIIGGVLQDIGKQVVVTSVLVQNLKKALNSLFLPGGASLGIGAGLALIALGGLLKNFKFNVPKFAEGGIATGPTLGVFGEAGKEAIIPLDRLPSLIKQANSGGNVNVTGRLTMDNRQLVANLSRAQTSFGRIN
jgi:hypothetical protein